MQKSMKFTIKPINQEIETVVEKIISLLKSLNFTDYNVRTQTLIVRQLVKNGIKYGNFTLPENEITIDIHITDNSITVDVMNPVNKRGRKKLSQLDKTMQFVKGYQDPFEAFTIMQKEAVKGNYDGDSNSLDLAEITYKGNVVLDFIIGEDDTLIQSAFRKFEGKNHIASSI